MKKTIMASILAFVLLNGFGPLLTQAGAETMNIKLVSMAEKLEMVKVTGVEGVLIGVVDRKGLGLLENGDIVTMACRAIFDTKKGFQTYSSVTFEDGSTVVMWSTGAISRSPATAKFREYGGKFEYVNGTGRFKGIKGNGTLTAKMPQWDKDFRPTGLTYYYFSGTYTLPSK
ncbi:MAG: hypothetical protein PVJ69_11305 [Desulfobacteraceae bacterium]|jgi:hypothetical protein